MPELLNSIATKRYADHRPRWLGLATMLLLLLLSALFWRERAWLLDVAYQTFLLVQEGTVQVQVYRFGAAVVQALPLLGVKLGLPLVWISLLYSVSFCLIYLLFYLLTTFVLRDEQLGLAIALLYTLITVDGFYWAASELQQGLGFLLLTWAFVRGRDRLNQPWHWLLLGPALVALAFYHPLVFIPFFFCWLYFAGEEERWRRPDYWAVAVVMIAILVVKEVVAANWYDTMKYDGFRTNLLQDFPNYFHYPAYAKFFQHVLTQGWGWTLCFVVVVTGLGMRRQWWALLLVLGFTAAYLVLMAIGSPEATYSFYAEVNYLPLVVFVALPFCCTLLPAWLLSFRYGWLLIGLLLAGRLLMIGLGHEPYRERWRWLTENLETRQESRFYLPADAAPLDTLLMTWAVPYESLLITGAKGPAFAKTLFIPPDSTTYADQLRSDSLFVTEFKVYPVEEINRHYFRLEQGTYQLME